MCALLGGLDDLLAAAVVPREIIWSLVAYPIPTLWAAATNLPSGFRARAPPIIVS